METPPKSFHARGLGLIVRVQGRMKQRIIVRFCALTCSRIGAETILAIGFSNKTTIQLFGGVSIFSATVFLGIWRNFEQYLRD